MKLDSISDMTMTLLDLKKKQADLNAEKTIQLRTKCELVKKMRIESYKLKTSELDEKERELCRKTNKLVDELVANCEDTPFNKALIKILKNLKGKLNRKKCRISRLPEQPRLFFFLWFSVFQ